MDQIPTPDLLNRLLTQRASIDMQFKFWLSTTFAVIVAGFTAGPEHPRCGLGGYRRNVRGERPGLNWKR